VARLACPAPVVKRAKSVLDRLEKGRAATGGLAAGLDDLPLFAAAIEAAEEGGQMHCARSSPRSDVDSLSPRAALDLLYELKRELVITLPLNPSPFGSGEWSR
jgi:DNA mismatch repair protein MutS